MTYLPGANYFDSSDHLLSSSEREEVGAADEEEIKINPQSSFKTPLRSSTSVFTHRQQVLNSGFLPPTTTARHHHSNFRNKRPISDEEAFRVMEELAFEVGRTATKVKSSRIVAQEEERQTEIGELESRRIEILRELDGFDVKLKELLSLTRG